MKSSPPNSSYLIQCSAFEIQQLIKQFILHPAFHPIKSGTSVLTYPEIGTHHAPKTELNTIQRNFNINYTIQQSIIIQTTQPPIYYTYNRSLPMQNLNPIQSPPSTTIPITSTQQQLPIPTSLIQNIPTFQTQPSNDRTFLWESSSSKPQPKIIQQCIRQNLIEEKQKYIASDRVTVGQTSAGNQICGIHSKPADLVCLQQNCIICSNCALFGKHKGHEIINREGLLTQFANYIQKCLIIYDDIKDIRTVFSTQLCTQNWQKLLFDSKNKNTSKIIQKFQNLQKTLKIIQKKQLLKLNQYYKQKDQLFRQYILPKISQIETKIWKWYAQIQGLGLLMSSTYNLEAIVTCLPYINNKKYNSSSSLIEEGQLLADNLDQLQYRICQYLNQQPFKQQLIFDQQLHKQLENYCTIKKQAIHKIKQVLESNNNEYSNSAGQSPIRKMNQNQHIGSKQNQIYMKNSTNSEENLLLSVQPINKNTQVHLRIPPSVTGVNFIAQELSPKKLEYLTISNIRPSHFTEQSQQRQKQLKDIVNLYNQNINQLLPPQNQKKKKKLGFPQKFKGIVDDLKYDRAETIDLTGAEAGDGSILSLCYYIRKSKKLKILKLVKNKLTDECMEELIKSISQTKITTLNLSQNSLSDKSCQILLQCPITHLKTITLSLNKINRRNAKSKLDSLTKKNIAILL